MSVADLLAPGVRLRESPLESSRFGIDVARLTIGEATGPDQPSDSIEEVVASCGAAVIITRWPARRTEMGGVLAQLGRRVIPADNLVYWEVAPAHLAQRPGAQGADCRVGELEATQLDALVCDTFADYPSHYSANPLFPADLALAGYREWAEHIRSTTPDLVVSLHEDGRPIAVATCAIDGGDLDILLAGVATAHQGGGKYGALLGGVARLAAERGVDRIIISTQAGNVNVQRAWARSGFVPFVAFATAHLVGEGL